MGDKDAQSVPFEVAADGYFLRGAILSSVAEVIAKLSAVFTAGLWGPSLAFSSLTSLRDFSDSS
jgi:hypothetical protein